MKFLATSAQAEAARIKRRAFPIHCYVGRNGSGKSLTAVWDTLPTLEAGRPVLSTVRLLDYENPRPCEGFESEAVNRQPCSDPMHGRPDHMQSHPYYLPFRSWVQLLEFQHGDILMDEITGVADSDEGASLPSAVKNKLPQLRRDDIPVRITSLNWIRVHKRIREACQAVTRCVGSMPAPRSAAFGEGRVFRPKRLIHQGTYDSQSLPTDDHTASAYEKADRLSRGRLWTPDCVAINAYDTFAPVMTVGTVTDTGRCAYCGGSRRAPECSCSDYQATKVSRRAAGAKGAPAPRTAGSAQNSNLASGCGCSGHP